MEALATKILSSKNIPFAQWPDRIDVPKETIASGIFTSKNKFWEVIERIHRYTLTGSERFSKKHEGSTGWEYEFMMAFVNGRFFYSTPHSSKNYENVKSAHSLNIKTERSSKDFSIIDYILLDDKKVGELRWIKEDELKRANLIKHDKFKAGFICQFHTHPLSQYHFFEQTESGEPQKYPHKIYTFFSPQDMISFFSSPMKMTGLVTDKLWIAAKTDKSTMPSHEDLLKVTYAEIEMVKGNIKLEDFKQIAAEVMMKYGIVLYFGEFGGEMRRLN